MEDVFIGEMSCEQCGLVHIRDPQLVTVWFSPDAREQLAEVFCAKCHKTTTAPISFDTMMVFKRYDCIFKNFNDKFAPLTEAEIEEWDIDNEFAAIC